MIRTNSVCDDEGNILPNVNIEDTEALDHQVPGHPNIGKNVGGGFLKFKENTGYILKPVHKLPLGAREVVFYSYIQGAKLDKELTDLLKVITPDFQGTTCVSSVGKDGKPVETEYLILKDITGGFTHPCILDIKMGKQTWEPSTSQEYIDARKHKYFGTRSTLGISIPGVLYYDIKEKIEIRLDKDFGRKLEVETAYEAVQNFLNRTSGVEKILAKAILKRLEKVNKFFEIQRKYAFYASSILVAYDAEFVQNNLMNYENGEEKESDFLKSENSDWLRVYMIDFTRVFPSGEQLDHNYLFALRNVNRMFSAIAEGKPDFVAE